MQRLDHVAQEVLNDIELGNTPNGYTEAMSAWRAYNECCTDIPDTINLVVSIHESTQQSEILEALILSNCPPEEIYQAFRVPVEVTKWYSELFFDVGVFRTDLDKIEYISTYKDKWGKDLKSKAVDLGYEFVLFTFANLVPRTSAQKKLVEKLFMATAYKAMAMNYNSINSDINKQAVKHAELMIKAYDLLVKTNADEVDTTYDLTKYLAASDNIIELPASNKDII